MSKIKDFLEDYIIVLVPLILYKLALVATLAGCFSVEIFRPK